MKKIKHKTNLRREAKGRNCQIRLEGICNFNPETTVFAHFRLKGICGIGIKPLDIIGAFACSRCHDEIDRRTRKLDYNVVEKSFLHGVIRTQVILAEEGKITW